MKTSNGVRRFGAGPIGNVVKGLLAAVLVLSLSSLLVPALVYGEQAASLEGVAVQQDDGGAGSDSAREDVLAPGVPDASHRGDDGCSTPSKGERQGRPCQRVARRRPRCWRDDRPCDGPDQRDLTGACSSRSGCDEHRLC